MECAVNIKVAGFVRVTLLFVASVVALSGIALARVNPSNGQAPRSAAMAGPVISSIPGIVLVGANFTVTGSGFTAGSVANFFIATGHGTINAGPLNQIAGTGTTVSFHLPATVTLGTGFCAVQVVNTDQSFAASNVAYALLQGSALAGIPSIN